MRPWGSNQSSYVDEKKEATVAVYCGERLDAKRLCLLIEVDTGSTFHISLNVVAVHEFTYQSDQFGRIDRGALGEGTSAPLTRREEARRALPFHVSPKMQTGRPDADIRQKRCQNGDYEPSGNQKAIA